MAQRIVIRSSGNFRLFLGMLNCSHFLKLGLFLFDNICVPYLTEVCQSLRNKIVFQISYSICGSYLMEYHLVVFISRFNYNQSKLSFLIIIIYYYHYHYDDDYYYYYCYYYVISFLLQYKWELKLECNIAG